MDLGTDTAKNIGSKIIEFMNEIINGFTTNFQVEFVFGIAVVLGIIIKRWQKWKGWIATIITILLIFFSLRFLGVGG